MFSRSGFALRASLFSRYAPIALAVFLIGCGGGSSDDTPPIVYGEDCSKISPVSDGDGGYEAYDYFLPFNSAGATVRSTTAEASYQTITDDETEELRKRLIEDSYKDTSGGVKVSYQKCNAGPGMHARVVFGDEEDKYKLVLSLYGNGGFVPNLDKFKEIFVDIGAQPSLFYVIRIYNDDMRAQFNNYIERNEDAGYSCGADGCNLSMSVWFDIFFPNHISWHIEPTE